MTEAATRGPDATGAATEDMDAARGQCAGRRAVLLCAGLAGAGVAIAGCSTAAVPYDANDAGQAPGADAAASSVATATASQAAAGSGEQSTGSKGGSTGSTGTVLGEASAIPVGGGTIFTSAKVVVTQPTKGEFKAFSAVCTHVGCLCDQVANGTINCPCHGSKFKITNGAVVAGPAPSALPAAKIHVTGGKILLE